MGLNTAKNNWLITLMTVLVLVSSAGHTGELKIGMSTALSGPLKEVGQDMRLGIETYFDKVNQSGGVNGSFLKLIVMDDGYEPGNAALNMRKLIDHHKVLGLVGNVGTPTAIVSLPIAVKKKVLFFGALTGADFLRSPEYQPYVVNFRASYADEAEVMVSGLLSMGIKPEEIAFFTQQDGYGEDGFQGAIRALENTGFDRVTQLAHGRYARNTLNVHDALATILDAEVEPRAVIMVGSYAPSAEFIRLAKKELPNLLFLNISFVGSKALSRSLGDEAEGVIITEVIPPFDSVLPAAEEYRADLKRYSARSVPGFVSFEGYLSAKIFVEGLSRIEGEITRDSVIGVFKNIRNVEIGIGNVLSLNSGTNQSLEKVWPVIIHNKQFKAYHWDKSQDWDKPQSTEEVTLH